MRQVVLDTETTGLEPESGHRIIEIGCVELIDRKKTGRTFHYYVNPEREVDLEAVEVHGITSEMLIDKPKFGDIAQEFLEFIQDSELVIHNAPFDVAFINAELARLGPEWDQLKDHCKVLDTQEMARRLHPGSRSSLDHLCHRYGVDNSGRELHGALLDAELLLDVYLAMTSGQENLFDDELFRVQHDQVPVISIDSDRPKLRVIKATEEELAKHNNYLKTLSKESGEKIYWD